MEQKIQYAIENFFVKDYFSPESNRYELTEMKEGRTKLDVEMKGESLCIADFDDKKKCSFFRSGKEIGLNKSSDHVIYHKKNGNWHLCIIEMKTSVGGNTWGNIKLKTRATYLNSLAIAAVLGISLQQENVDVYTTYENEKFYSLEGTTVPLAHKAMLGERKYDSKKEEWEKNRIFINLGDKVQFRHHAVQLNRNIENDTLEGRIAI